MTKWFQREILVILSLCWLDNLKSAAGINLSQRYHAIDRVRVPARFVVHQVKARLTPDGSALCQQG
jgi:hypothetical protein